MHKILITGGAGFIGSNFTLGYFERHHDAEITVIDKLTYAGRLANLQPILKSSRFHFIQADLADRNRVGEIISGGNFQYIVHMAAESHVDRSIKEPSVFIQTNIIGTANLLDAVRESGWMRDNNGETERKFVHVSTDEVFGSLGKNDSPFTENSPLCPNSPYSASKASADLLVRAAWKTYGLPVISTRCSNNYGPYQYPEKLIPLIIRSCLNNRDIPVYGRGENIRDWIYVQDHCRALDLIVQKGRPGETYNIGGNNEKCNLDLVVEICGIMMELKPRSVHYKELIKFVDDRPGHDFRYAVDSSKIIRELGWSVESEFGQSLRSTVQWYLQNEEFLNINI